MPRGLLSRLWSCFARTTHRPTRSRRKSTTRCQLEWLEPRIVAHANPVEDAEHAAVFALVPDSAATNIAVHSGRWDDPATWDSRGIPAAGANVIVAAGTRVELDAVHTEALHTIRVDGVLHFDTNVNTELTVDTTIVAPSGTLEIGTAADPEQPNVEAILRIANNGKAIDTKWDPYQYSRSLISHGVVSMHGTTRTPFAAVSGSGVAAGATSIALSQVPVGWAVGDQLVLTATSANVNQNEQLQLTSINGNVVTFQRQGSSANSLAFDHLVPTGMSVYLADMTRNVVVESQSTAQTQFRGHVMFMHVPTVDVEYVGFYGLGRTDKTTPLANAQFDANGKLIPGTGTNQVGRYAVHFHRTGSDPGDPAVNCIGCVVVGSPGWGFVNHSSNVLMRDNVAFNVVGADFVTEAGDEIGTFDHNLAIGSRGTPGSTAASGMVEARKNVPDYGYQGDGFWFQGPGVTVTNNIAVSQYHAGFVYFPVGLFQAGLGTTEFDTGNLPSAIRKLFGTAKTVDVELVPIFGFKNNTAIGAGEFGFASWFHLWAAPAGDTDVIDGFRSWHTGEAAMYFSYANNTTTRNAVLLGDTNAPSGIGIEQYVASNLNFQNDTIGGYRTGIQIPASGTNAVHGGTFTNIVNIHITTQMTNATDEAKPGRIVTIDGPIRFGSPANLEGQTPLDLDLETNFAPRKLDITTLFNSDTIVYQGRQIYYNEQSSVFAPFANLGQTLSTPAYDPQNPFGVMGGNDGGTSISSLDLSQMPNASLFSLFGLALGGAVAPDDAGYDFKINGLIGGTAQILPKVQLLSATYTNKLNNYLLSYQVAGSKPVKETQSIMLTPGWNVITRMIAGQPHAFLVYGDNSAPMFSINRAQLVLNPADLNQRLSLLGTFWDDSSGPFSMFLYFTNLNQLPVRTKTTSNGIKVKFVRLTTTIQDYAGNTTVVNLDLVLDTHAPLLQRRS